MKHLEDGAGGHGSRDVSTPLPRRSPPAEDLASALRRAAAAHGEHEADIGAEDRSWPDWYVRYMVSEQAGTEVPS
ncbi:hypothetical protein GCM10010206_17930 [Streptomyces cinerochromogenes]|nr:hypothetical protein GCM10010206_17930 [Streptomyces cinerochromogenes]